jgi:hypothetical protein
VGPSRGKGRELESCRSGGRAAARADGVSRAGDSGLGKRGGGGGGEEEGERERERERESGWARMHL